jgi:opacity protein-like surface antigen
MLRLLVPLLLLATSFAQTTETYGTQRGEFSTWTSFSVGGNAHIFGFAQNRSLYLTGIRYGWTLAHWNKLGGMNLRYTPEIIPAAYLRDRVVKGQPVALDKFAFPAVPSDQYVFGGGVNPVGLQMNFRRGKRIQPLWDFEGGFLYFTRHVLTVDGSQFQFTVATGPGVQFYFTPQTALTVGYRYHHMSNANISGHNPGTDTNHLYFSFSLFR